MYLKFGTCTSTNFQEILSDCTPKEIDSIFKIVKRVKDNHAQRNLNTDIWKNGLEHISNPFHFLVYEPESCDLTPGLFNYKPPVL